MEFLTWAFSFPSLSVSLGIPQSVLAGRGREEGASYRLEQPHAHRIPPLFLWKGQGLSVCEHSSSSLRGSPALADAPS